MDTNSNTSINMFNFKAHNLGDFGYGPGGIYKREDWRELCLVKIKGSKVEFSEWIENSFKNEKKDYISFTYQIICEDGALIKQDAYCHRCSLDLIGCVFNENDLEHFNLNEYEFPFPVLLSFAVFHADVTFDRTEFNDDLWLDYAIFKRQAIFSRVKIKGDAWFNNAQFFMNACFVKTDFSSISVFKQADFNDVSSFEDATFKNVGHFEGAKFKIKVPNFLGVSIENTHLEFSNDTFFSEHEITEQSIKYLERLKRLSDQHGQTDHALMFNAFELNAKRARSMDEVNHLKWWQKLFNDHAWLAWTTYAYDKLSNYGRSFTRPLLAYWVLMLVTFVVALGHGLWASMDGCDRAGWNIYEQLYRDQVSCPVVSTVGEQRIPLTVPRAAFEYTAYRASGVLDFVDADKQTIAVAKRLFNADIEPWWMRIYGVCKAIASTALLFLAALGLRNKYRIK